MRCDACHSGAFTSQGTKGAMGTASFSGHVATNGADCASCHARSVSGGYVSWTGGVFTHKATDTNCSSCHNGAVAKGMTTPPHIPVTGIQCSNCHVNTAASFTTYTMSHSAVHATRCDSCHNGSYTGQGKRGAKGPEHKAKSQDCGCCHTGAAVSFSTWDDNPKDSAGTCTTTAKSVTNPMTAVRSAMQSVANRTMTAVTSAINSATGRIGGSATQSSGSPAPAPGPATNNAAAPQSALAKGDKEAAGASTAAGTPPAAAASSAPSATIAANDGRSKLAPTIGPSTADQSLQPGARLAPAQQLGLSAAPAAGAVSSRFDHMTTRGPCASCHNGNAATGKSPKHVPTTASCDTCHKSTATFAGARFTHAGTTAACATCHNGGIASGKPQKHVPTSASCETCHKSTATFAGARFSHTATTAACASCHNGGTASGKPPKHVPTTASCDTCHKSTATFAGARFSHSATMAACASCHNGGTASGKPQKHVVTSAACETCHKSTVTFSGARMDHATLTAPCASCHNGTTASGKGPKHFVTTVPCESCHRTVSWSSVTYRHVSASYPNHGATIACSACHAGNSQVVTWKFAASKPDCGGCHTDDFRPQQHVKSLKPVPMNYTAAELKDCTGACHIYADKSGTTIQTRRQRLHRVNGGSW
jgi:hypothetical protein